MRTTPLSTHSLLELIDLFEQSSQSITDTEGQRLRGVPGWELSRRTALSAHDLATWTECVGYAGGYPAPCGDAAVMVDIEEDDDPGQYRYLCPDTFRTKYLPAAIAAVHVVTAGKMLHYVADLLGIARALRGGVAAPAIDGVLWQLGRMRIADAQVDVWLVRDLATQVEQIFTHFQQASLPGRGLILTTGQALPEIVPPPRDYRIVPIHDVLVEHALSPHIDVDLIHRLLLAAPGETAEKSSAVSFNEYTNTLVIATRSDKPWTIKGERQIAAVRYLHEQFLNGRRWLPAHEILDAAYGNKRSGRSQRMQNLFSGNTEWEHYIANPEKGKYGFRLD